MKSIKLAAISLMAASAMASFHAPDTVLLDNGNFIPPQKKKTGALKQRRKISKRGKRK